MRPLAEVALVGTGRRGGDGAVGEPAASLLAPLPTTTERRLLFAAAVDAARRRVGRVAESGIAAPSPSPPEAWPACARGAADVLAVVVLPAWREVLPEAIARLRAARWRAPPALLPALLDTRDRALLPSLVEVVGERGRWLAAQHPPWRWILSAAPAPRALDELLRTFEEGNPYERLGALRAARLVDAAEGRAWLEAAWTREKAEVREALLGALEVALGDGDEPLLERALGDRAQGVRLAAAGLLARLPSSALARRMRERAEAMLAWQPARSGFAAVVTVEPPTTIPPEWERDGVTEKPPPGLGERAHWLAQVAARVPPSTWEQRFAASPSAIVPAAWAGDWGLPLALGLTRAALAFRAEAWGGPLWDGWLAAARADGDAAKRALQLAAGALPSLLELMGPAAAEERALDLLRRGGGAPVPLATVMERAGRPFGARLAAAWLTAFARWSTVSDGPRGEWVATLGPAALALPAAHLDAAARLAETAIAVAERATLRAIERFLDVVRLRARLAKEIPA